MEIVVVLAHGSVSRLFWVHEGREREREECTCFLQGLAYPMATDAWPIGHARGPASKRFRTVFVDMSLHAVADFCTGDTRKIAVDNRFLASVRRCCINLASVPTSFRKVNYKLILYILCILFYNCDCKTVDCEIVEIFISFNSSLHNEIILIRLMLILYLVFHFDIHRCSMY